MERKWYQQTWAIIALLWLFFPVGLYLMWRHALWSRQIKWGISAAFGLLVVVVFVLGSVGGNGDDADEVTGDETPAPQTGTSTAGPETSPTQAATGTAGPETSPTQVTTEAPTSTPLPSWEDGAPTTEDTVRAALEDADEMIRSEDLGNPTRVVASMGTVIVEYKADSILGETDLLTVAAQTTYSAMRTLFLNPRVESVSVNIVADWTDQYGRTREEPTTSVFLTREFVDSRVDWGGLKDLVYADNKHIYCIVELAEDYYIHPAIYARLEDKGCLLQFR